MINQEELVGHKSHMTVLSGIGAGKYEIDETLDGEKVITNSSSIEIQDSECKIIDHKKHMRRISLAKKKKKNRWKRKHNK